MILQLMIFHLPILSKISILTTFLRLSRPCLPLSQRRCSHSALNNGKNYIPKLENLNCMKAVSDKKVWFLLPALMIVWRNKMCSLEILAHMLQVQHKNLKTCIGSSSTLPLEGEGLNYLVKTTISDLVG